MPPEVLALLTPESVTPGLLALAAESAPTRTILNAGAGVFATSHITLSPGVKVGQGADAPEVLLARWAQVTDRTGDTVPGSGAAQTQQEVSQALQG